ncbi:MAG: hypothetical protein NTW65_06965 [Deltaproteobacteria bacterium]|nr:hypothetical protein [Deltaproteobacteria bacterium]
MRSMCFIVLIFLLASPCHAFKPREQHDPISKKAISLYQICTGHAIPEELSNVFIERVVAEDDISLARLGNWHFYNNGNKIGRYYLLFYGANDKTFQKLLKKLENLIASSQPRKEEIYKVAGHIAHHIQDMNAPAHVMPIYHVGEDKFDNYTPASVFGVNITEFCKALSGPVIVPSDLLEQAAQNTLKAVSGQVVFNSDKTFKNETWMKFWGGPENRDLAGFKTYGEYKNVFGLVPPCDSSVCGSYDKDTYDRFFNECYMRAVMDTARLLLFLDQRYTVRP